VSRSICRGEIPNGHLARCEVGSGQAVKAWRRSHPGNCPKPLARRGGRAASPAIQFLSGRCGRPPRGSGGSGIAPRIPRGGRLPPGGWRTPIPFVPGRHRRSGFRRCQKRGCRGISRRRKGCRLSLVPLAPGALQVLLAKVRWPRHLLARARPSLRRRWWITGASGRAARRGGLRARRGRVSSPSRTSP